MNHKIALITGAGSGIGRACSIALAEQAYTLVLVGRNIVALKATEAALAQNKLAHLSYVCDVSNSDEVDALFTKVEADYGRLDLLFNNAGSGALPLPIDELAVSEWHRVLGVNLTGSYLCARQAFRLMKHQSPRGGRIINNGSVSAHVPRPNSAPYTATKHAITGLTRSLSLDGRDFNIVCGQIDIGNAATEMTQLMARGMPQADGSIRSEPTMDVEDVAKALCYMADLPLSANVQFITVMASNMPMIGRG